MVGISLELFHLDAEKQTQKLRISLSASDTVVVTAGRIRQHALVLSRLSSSHDLLGALLTTVSRRLQLRRGAVSVETTSSQLCCV